MHVILAPDDKHKEVFLDVLLIGFKNDKILRDHLVRSRLPDIEETGMSKSSGRKRPPCHLCKNMKTHAHSKVNTLMRYKINNDYKCNSKMAVYLIECRVCGEQDTGSTKSQFRSRANNYKSTHRKFISKKEVPKQALKQKRFYDYYCTEGHTGIEDWVITLIDRADTLKELKKKELYWMNKL